MTKKGFAHWVKTVNGSLGIEGAGDRIGWLLVQGENFAPMPRQRAKTSMSDFKKKLSEQSAKGMQIVVVLGETNSSSLGITQKRGTNFLKKQR